MSQARVQDVDYLKDFRPALQKFQEAAGVALTDAESVLVRTLLWLETEQTTYWKVAVRKRAEALSQAEERLRAKKIFRDATGAKQSTVDEEKAVKVARQRLEQANLKVAAVSRWKRQMEKVSHDYKGTVQRFATNVQTMLPAAIARLEVMVRQLEQYVGLQAREIASTASGIDSSTPSFPGSDESQSMKRGIIDEPQPQGENLAKPAAPPETAHRENRQTGAPNEG